jgi:hypothetical protein
VLAGGLFMAEVAWWLFVYVPAALWWIGTIRRAVYVVRYHDLKD